MKKAMKKFGCAVHGTGWVSTEHIRAYMLNPHCRVVALSSRNGRKPHSQALASAVLRVHVERAIH